MRLKIGDRVRITANKKQLRLMGIEGCNLTGVEGKLSVKNPGVWRVDCRGKKHGGKWWIKTEYLELVNATPQTKPTNPKDSTGIRKFETGATRDTDQGKLDYTRALSPIVLERYVQYLNKHRKQPDGSMREFDNWKKGLPFRESFSSLGRHYIDVWKMIEGYPAEDNHGPCNQEDSLCAIIFNATTMLLELLEGKDK